MIESMTDAELVRELASRYSTIVIAAVRPKLKSSGRKPPREIAISFIGDQLEAYAAADVLKLKIAEAMLE